MARIVKKRVELITDTRVSSVVKYTTETLPKTSNTTDSENFTVSTSSDMSRQDLADLYDIIGDILDL